MTPQDVQDMRRAVALAVLAAIVVAILTLFAGCAVLDVLVPDNQLCLDECLSRCEDSPSVLVPSRCPSICRTECAGGG